ncbi:MAG: hypothetical protein OXJ52_10250 [Oligoflexia bacterium]|nr:hypothetical protein [Oligoflexia bacterium]
MSFLKHNKAFSLTELLTTVGIVGTLSVVGIKSYQKQTNQAKTAEAKKSLSYVYAAERSFYNNWGGYHENLSAIGAIPVGSYIYDVGFGRSAALASNYGSLGSYPRVATKNVLDVRECTTFKQICDGDCLSTIRSSVGSPHDAYFTGSSDCAVHSLRLLKNYSGTQSGTVNSAGASLNSFTVMAVTQLKKTDIWSMNKNAVLRHENDGTQ